MSPSSAVDRVVQLVRTQLVLLATYVRGVPLLLRVPEVLRQPSKLVERLESAAPTGKTFQIAVPNNLLSEYAELLENMRKQCLAVADCCLFRHFDRSILPAMLCLRIVATAIALAYGRAAAPVVWGLMLLQFVIAPLSLVPALTTVVALAPTMFIGHYLSVPALSFLCSCVPGGGWLLGLSIPISAAAIAIAFAVDQLLCVVCLFWNPSGKPQFPSASLLWKSIVYGFVNAKTYQLMMFGLLQGFSVPVGVLALDYTLGLSRRIGDAVNATGYNWSALFYHQHRMAHMPHVYQHAHKFHHYLQGTTSFDAHLYGLGLPEEFFCLALEYLGAAALGVPPATLNFQTLYHSWTDKIGHTMKQANIDGCNAHPFHHVYHTKNYGIFDMSLDLLFGTCSHENEFPVSCGYIARRRVDKGSVVLTFSPNDASART